MKLISFMNILTNSYRKIIIVAIMSLAFIFQSSCKDTTDSNEESKKDLELKEKELALKEKDIKLKEEELLRKREENIERKENELNQMKKYEINLEGEYSGSIRDGTYWTMIINNFDGKNFTGYNIVYWEKHPDGMRTNCTGEYNLSDKTITIYEDRSTYGSGTFYGTVSSDGNNISGTWYRYSDGGSYLWNLRKN